MKYRNEFRRPQTAKALCQAIGRTLSQLGEQEIWRGKSSVRIMEFCGGHTHTLFRYGLEELLDAHSHSLAVRMIHGPGCPVCVLPIRRVQRCISISEQANVVLCSFGDALRIPGQHGNLLDAKARGADVRTIYSPLDALDLAQSLPEKEIVFFALGFETTMPATALTIKQAHGRKIKNFSVFCNHIRTAPTLEALLQDPELELDGLVAPGHVATVVGLDEFRFASEQYNKPLVVAGFEPNDLLQAIHMVLLQLAEGRVAIENQYRRAVRNEGSSTAQQVLQQVFCTSQDDTELRGFGEIISGRLCLRPEYAAYDAEIKFASVCSTHSAPFPPNHENHKNQGYKKTLGVQAEIEHKELQRVARCTDVLKGKLKPTECSLFARNCCPQTPFGALMVSAEGSCAAYYRKSRITAGTYL